MVQENYSGRSQVGEKGCGVGGAPYQAAPVPPPSGYTSGNFDKLLNSLPKKIDTTVNETLNNSLPIPTMDSVGASNDSCDDENNSIIYNRFIYANKNSRLRGQGDPIRGDLRIPPRRDNWFNVSANPTVSLQQGALQVMAGMQLDNDDVLDGIRLAAASGDSYYAGSLMTPQQLSSINAMTDVTVSRLPL
jgi:hypothetical protein